MTSRATTRRPTASARFRAIALLLLLVAAGPRLAQAADICTVAALPVSFGAYDPIATTPSTGTGSIAVECTGNPHDVVIALSTGNSGAYTLRRMQLSGGTATLGYNLYVDPAHTQVFGDGTGGTFTAQCKTGTSSNGCIGSNPSGSTRRAVRPFYGLLPAGQDVAPGDYRDTVRVDVIF